MGKTMSRASCLVLGLALAIGAGTTPAVADTNAGYQLWNEGDFYGAVAQWRPAAIAGDPTAQYNLARAYQLGRGVPVDLKMAETWFGKAATQGHLPSRDNYGLVLFQNGDRTSAMPYIEEASDRGDSRAQYVLGTALFNGDTVKKDWVRAYALMIRASAAGIGAASSSLAQMDKYVPVDQRQRGLTLARKLETAGDGRAGWRRGAAAQCRFCREPATFGRRRIAEAHGKTRVETYAPARQDHACKRCSDQTVTGQGRLCAQVFASG
jgi:TPR repeat protein